MVLTALCSCSAFAAGAACVLPRPGRGKMWCCWWKACCFSAGAVLHGCRWPWAWLPSTMRRGFCLPACRRGQAKNRADCCHCADAAALVYCKYTNFLLDTLNVIASTGFAKLSFLDVLPLGISYYTFKLISYTADVYTGKVKAERSPVVFAVYVLMYRS